MKKLPIVITTHFGDALRAARKGANTGAHLHPHSRGAHGRQESLWI